MLIKNVLYRAQVKATAGRDTRAVSSDGVREPIVLQFPARVRVRPTSDSK